MHKSLQFLLVGFISMLVLVAWQFGWEQAGVAVLLFSIFISVMAALANFLEID